jgi:hypothetical protein
MVDMYAFRIALLVTLLVLLAVILFRRYRAWVLRQEQPAIRHAELTRLEVSYHPTRLHIRLAVPARQEVHIGLLAADHAPLRQWPAMEVNTGAHDVEQLLENLPDGIYHVEVSTTTQRTVRQFRLQQA